LHNNGHASTRNKLTPWPLGIAVYQLFNTVLFINTIRNGFRGSESLLSYRSNARSRGLMRRKSWQVIRVIGNYRPRFSRAFREPLRKPLQAGYRFLHQYLIAANKMAMVCAPPRWAIKAWGAVIVNVHSRYILTRPCMPSTRRETKIERNEEPRDRVSPAKRRWREISSTKIEQIIQHSLAVSLRIVNRRCQEIRERFEARLLKHPSFGCDRGLFSVSYNYEYARLYVFGHSTSNE